MSLITLQGVDYGVGGPLLLEYVNLTIERNERVCILGRNGAGKSTLLRLLGSEISPDDGAIKREGCIAGLALQDFDIYEIHEAFAAQVLCTLRAWESEDYCRSRLGLDAPLGRIDPAKINPVGSSLAAGHPFAATGARIVATAAKQLKERGGGRALVSICTAGGMGVVAILER